MLRPLAVLLFVSAFSARAAEPVSFSRDVLPILSDNCFACHGQDESHRKADLRLDTREGATAVSGGIAAIMPGKPEQSELFTRIISDDADEMMPPPKSHKPKLTAAQIDVLKRWIEAGAPWGKHWAFEKPVRPEVPFGAPPSGGSLGVPASAGPPKGGTPNQAIDAFVRARLAKEGLSPAPEAERHTLLRRVSFDLVGLPPTTEEVNAFVNDAAPDAYAKVVDRLLASPHFGERMAMWWLDAARYSDTDGFQADANRENWPWRDWVVEAFNTNMRFDQFTLEQFAGDLLPNATAEQKLATCFHRNHMTNGEGGRDPEESRVDYVLDRVNTMGTVWLGLSLGCTQCHSHKFDPVSQADYYGLTAFFNSIDEDGKAGKNAKPYLAYESKHTPRAIEEAQQMVDERKPREALARQDAEKPFGDWLAARSAEVRGGFTAWHPLRGALESSEGTELAQEADATVQASGPHPNQDDYRLIAPVKLARVTGLRLEVFPHASHTNGAFTRGKSGEFILTDIKVQIRRHGSSQIRDILVKNAVADYSPDQKERRAYGDVKGVLDDDPRNGWTTKGAPAIAPHTAVFALDEPLVLASDEELIFELRQRSTDGDANLGRFRVSVTDQRGPAVAGVGPAPLEQLAAAGSADDKLRARLFDQFLADYEPYQKAKSSLDLANSQLKEAQNGKKVNVMVLTERKQTRDTFVLVRGVWDKHGPKVERGGLPQLAPWTAEGRTRADLARWLTSSENPLTARVLVNHLWQMCFGSGLVRTTEDFGLQGEPPTHPELLDWLAVECLESGWDLKHLLKLIVTSATYRQSSAIPESGDRKAESVAAASSPVSALQSPILEDPENRLLARGARFRLPAWMLRDSALRAAGLMNPALGGPPTRPYQPEGVWEENFMGRFTYQPSEGAAQYRRTLYAFWRRSIAPTFLFDSAQRRSCEVRTARTNTPLQALTLLNDENFLEAARAVATHALRSDDPLRHIAQRVLSRAPSEAELGIFTRERDRALKHYRAHPQDAAKFLDRGQSGPDAKLSAPDLAAHTVVASMILNLDEAITHE